MNDTDLQSGVVRTFPARLVLAADQFFEVLRYNSELWRLAHRKAYQEAVGQGLKASDLSARVERSAEVLRGDPAVKADAALVVSLASWSPWSKTEPKLPTEDVGRLERIDDESLLNASRWRSVSEVPNFPFSSFREMLTAIEAGRCYISVAPLAFRFANLTYRRVAQAFSGFLSCVPILIALASIVAAIVWKNPLILLGMPAALFASIVGASAIIPVRPLLFAASLDSSLPFPIRIAARICLLLLNPNVALFLGVVLLNWMFFTDRPSATWIVGSYLFSVNAIRAFRARGVIALSSAAKRSEPFFLYALSNGLCGIRERESGDFLRMPERQLD